MIHARKRTKPTTLRVRVNRATLNLFDASQAIRLSGRRVFLLYRAGTVMEELEGARPG